MPRWNDVPNEYRGREPIRVNLSSGPPEDRTSHSRVLRRKSQNVIDPIRSPARERRNSYVGVFPELTLRATNGHRDPLRFRI